MVSDYQRYECETYISGKDQRSYKCMMIFTRYQGFIQRGGALEFPPPESLKICIVKVAGPSQLSTCKFEVPSPCSHGDMSQNVPGSPVLKFCRKCNETLLRTLHVEVRILTVY